MTLDNLSGLSPEDRNMRKVGDACRSLSGTRNLLKDWEATLSGLESLLQDLVHVETQP